MKLSYTVFITVLVLVVATCVKADHSELERRLNITKRQSSGNSNYDFSDIERRLNESRRRLDDISRRYGSGRDSSYDTDLDFSVDKSILIVIPIGVVLCIFVPLFVPLCIGCYRTWRASKRCGVQLRVYSLFWWLYSWLYIAYIALYVSTSWLQVEAFLYLTILMSVELLMFYIVIMIESYRSREKKYLTSLRDLEPIAGHIEGLRKAQPKITWTAICFHMEARNNGKQTFQVPVTTHTESKVRTQTFHKFLIRIFFGGGVWGG